VNPAKINTSKQGSVVLETAVSDHAMAVAIVPVQFVTLKTCNGIQVVDKAVCSDTNLGPAG